jgi:dCMP deaminase
VSDLAIVTDQSALEMDFERRNLSRSDYEVGFARHVATKSNGETHSGAFLVAPDGRAALIAAYNGPSAEVYALPEPRKRPQMYLFSSHPKANLVALVAREGIRISGCAVYVSHYLCTACARTLIQAGSAKSSIDLHPAPVVQARIRVDEHLRRHERPGDVRG